MRDVSPCGLAVAAATEEHYFLSLFNSGKRVPNVPGHGRFTSKGSPKVWHLQSPGSNISTWTGYHERQAVRRKRTALHVKPLMVGWSYAGALPWSFNLRDRYCSPVLQSLQRSQSVIKDIGLQEDSDPDGREDNDFGRHEEEKDIQQESFIGLEWSAVCGQVSQFASTPTGVETAKKGRLTIGKNQEESEELLNQTAAAILLPMPLDFSGIADVGDILRLAISGSTCTVNELCIVQTFLFSAKRLSNQLYDASLKFLHKGGAQTNAFSEIKNPALSPLLSIMAGLDFCTSLEEKLASSLDNSSMSVMDGASLTLAACRCDRRNNMKVLESLLYEISGNVVKAGGMDTVLVTKRRSRLCVAVRASHKSLIRNGVVLDVSNTGATLFMEPEAALEFNNKEVQLASLEKAEEAVILKGLTCRLADAAENVFKLLDKITLLDLACARACHAKWLGSVKPAFVMPRDNLGGDEQVPIAGLGNNSISFAVSIDSLCHPLLLGPAIMESDNGLSTTYHDSVRQLNDSFRKSKPKFPVPIDIKVKSGVQVVVISGPNTGGKTATMKTLGVAVLMAKAGLFLPAKGQAVLPWFNKVLVDIGDGQSLEQSLSTFGGHIQKLCKIIEAGDRRSLVLLDEIGSGTDPSEGAALAAGLLQYMVDHALLTLATTHYADLGRLKEEDQRFEIASMEFDIRTLRPTYNLHWGRGGQSNAIEIASSLGFDQMVLTRVHYWLTKLGPEHRGEYTSKLMLALLKQRNDLQTRAAEAASVLSEARKLHDELLSEIEDLDKRQAALQLQQEDDVNKDISAAKSYMDEIVSSFAGSRENSLGDGKVMPFHAAQSAIAAVVHEYKSRFGKSPMAQANTAVEAPAVGDKVLIRKLGKKLATVVEVSTNADELIVQLGSMKIRVSMSDLIRTVKQGNA